MKTYENEWSNFSENQRVVALKLLGLTQFASPNLWIYFNYVRCLGPLLRGSAQGDVDNF